MEMIAAAGRWKLVEKENKCRTAKFNEDDISEVARLKEHENHTEVKDAAAK